MSIVTRFDALPVPAPLVALSDSLTIPVPPEVHATFELPAKACCGLLLGDFCDCLEFVASWQMGVANYDRRLGDVR